MNDSASARTNRASASSPSPPLPHPSPVAITEWRSQFRRELNKLDNAMSQRGLEALLNFETVSYFTGKEYEAGRYGEAIGAYQSKEIVNLMALTFLNITQSLIVLAGLASGLVLCTQRAVEGRFDTGSLVLFITYLAQLFAPLNYFGMYYSSIQSNVVDMENLVELLDLKSAVEDPPGAPPLALSAGAVAFEAVSFSYDPRRAVLTGLTFRCPGGTTLALVGATGSGKSTVMRLLFRFFDPTSGRVLIDGQDSEGCPWNRCAGGSRWCRRTWCSSTTPSR